jgi:hypothetical protein
MNYERLLLLFGVRLDSYVLVAYTSINACAIHLGITYIINYVLYSFAFSFPPDL